MLTSDLLPLLSLLCIPCSTSIPSLESTFSSLLLSPGMASPSSSSPAILSGPTVPELWASDPSWYIGGLLLAGMFDQLLFGILAM